MHPWGHVFEVQLFKGVNWTQAEQEHYVLQKHQQLPSIVASIGRHIVNPSDYVTKLAVCMLDV